MKVIVLSGLPASGKSTWAEEFIKNNKDWKRVNKDSLRSMFDFGKWSGKNENLVLQVRDMLIRDLLLEGYNVIVDDTNLHPKHLERVREIAGHINKGGAVQVEIEEKFFDTPLTECIRRDSLRANPVGAKRIYGMWRQFLEPEPPDYRLDLDDAAIVDLDGTLAKHKGRSPYNYDLLHTDEVNMDILQLITNLALDVRVIIVSGRPDTYMEDTVNWLHGNNVPFDEIYMRSASDDREDSIVKKEIYENNIKDRYNVRYVFDDRDRVVAMWRSLGLRCLQVNYGPF